MEVVRSKAHIGVTVRSGKPEFDARMRRTGTILQPVQHEIER